MLALVHPLLQVYTLPSTGQVAYVGHVCNFRQKVSKFISTLPTVPQDMPFVQVRPRSMGNRPSFRAPFKVNVDKLRHAFLWLKEFNPYYHDVEWLDASAAEWLRDDVELPTRVDEETECGQALPVNHESLLSWMQHALHAESGGDGGYAIGSRLLAVLETDVGDAFELWDALRAMAADILASSSLRAATSVDQEVIAVVLHEQGQLDLGIDIAGGVKEVLSHLRAMPYEEWSEDYTVMRQELAAIFLDMMAEEPIISAGVVSEQPVPDDVGVRADCLDHMQRAVSKHFGGESCGADETDNGAPSLAGASVEQVGGLTIGAAIQHQNSCRAGAPEGASQPCPPDASKRKFKYPRVDAPEIEDGPGEAIREDTPGYIVMAFPKLFPHGTGDFHSGRGEVKRIFKFEEWGRYVMSWHDGRFMRHTRFRYWLLDTSLRLITPGMQRTFFKTHEAATSYTLDDLSNKEIRTKLLQQMSTATSDLPGSVGERRRMRQELEAMVHQIEAETADAGENGGAGRIPAGFCTLTCPVYKWHQEDMFKLHVCYELRVPLRISRCPRFMMTSHVYQSHIRFIFWSRCR